MRLLRSWGLLAAWCLLALLVALLRCCERAALQHACSGYEPSFRAHLAVRPTGSGVPFADVGTLSGRTTWGVRLTCALGVRQSRHVHATVSEEAGANPARSRHCHRGADPSTATAHSGGKAGARTDPGARTLRPPRPSTRGEDPEKGPSCLQDPATALFCCCPRPIPTCWPPRPAAPITGWRTPHAWTRRISRRSSTAATWSSCACWAASRCGARDSRRCAASRSRRSC